MKGDLRIAAAEAEVERSRAQLIETLNDAAALFEPRKILGEVWETAKSKGADLAEDAVDAVASRPIILGGALAAVAAFLAREPIKDAAVKAYGAMTSSKAETRKTNKGAGTADRVAAKPEIKPETTPRRRPTRRKAKTETPS